MELAKLRKSSFLALALTIAACSQADEGQQLPTISGDGERVTLYRNSPFSRVVRVHWSTFDTSDGLDYNLGNCQMAARLLNANLAASAKAEGKEPYPGVGFWCEIGGFEGSGGVPGHFESAFPTDTTSPLRFTEYRSVRLSAAL